MEWSSEVIMEFLNLYEGEPSIWNPQNADHKDRNKIHDAWKRIENRISVDCSISELKKKKENLMATYRKLALKVKNSRRTGGGGSTSEVYKPEWFAYEKMESFLHNIYTPRKTKAPDEGPDNEPDDPSSNEHTTPDPVDSSEMNTACYDEESYDAAAAAESAVIDQVGPLITNRKRKADHIGNVERRMDEAYSFLKRIVNKSKSGKDESSLFCELLCLKLKALDDDAREIAMHEINNLMFNLKKPNIQQPYWSFNNHSSYQQPGYFANPVQYARGVNPTESSIDGSENSFSSGVSSGHNPDTKESEINKPSKAADSVLPS